MGLGRSTRAVNPTLESTQSGQDDATLILSVARHHDETAFEILARRHAPAMYSIARHLTGNSGLAEDVVQISLMELWQNAKTFVPGPSRARSWLLRIAANQAVTIKTKADRSAKRTRRTAFASPCTQPGEQSAPEQVEGQEILAALHNLLERLPEFERRLIALYYGGDLTQDEIADLLEIPQRTVSDRLNKSVELLRTKLKAAHFALALPLASLLATAVTSVRGLSASALETLLQSALRTGPGGARTGGERTRSRPWALGTLPCVLGLLALLAHLAWEDNPGEAPASRRNTSTDTAPRPRRPPLPAESQFPSQPGRFLRAWNFERPEQLMEFEQAVDPKLNLGRIRHSASEGLGGSGCLVFDECAILILRLPPDTLPLMVTLSWATSKVQGGSGPSLGCSGLFETAAFRNVGYRIQTTTGRRMGWHKFRFYLTEDSIERWTEPYGRSDVKLIARSRAARDVYILSYAGAELLDNLRIEQISPQEVPRLDEFREAWARLAPGIRNGQLVPVPALKGHATPGYQVLLEFLRE